MQAPVAIAMAVASVFVCVGAAGHVGRSQEQRHQLDGTEQSGLALISINQWLSRRFLTGPEQVECSRM